MVEDSPKNQLRRAGLFGPLSLSLSLSAQPVDWWNRTCRLQLCRGVRYPSNEAIWWPWGATSDDWGGDPVGWAVTRIAIVHFGSYCVRWMVGEARSDPSSGDVSPLYLYDYPDRILSSALETNKHPTLIL